MLALMDKRPDLLQRFDLSSVRHLGVGRSGIDNGLLQRSLERFPHVTWDYSWSQSELNSGDTNVSGDEWLKRLHSCGRPIGCVKALSIQSEGERSGPGRCRGGLRSEHDGDDRIPP